MADLWSRTVVYTHLRCVCYVNLCPWLRLHCSDHILTQQVLLLTHCDGAVVLSLCKDRTAVLCRRRALDSGWWTNSCCSLPSPNAAPLPQSFCHVWLWLWVSLNFTSCSCCIYIRLLVNPILDFSSVFPALCLLLLTYSRVIASYSVTLHVQHFILSFWMHPALWPPLDFLACPWGVSTSFWPQTHFKCASPKLQQFNKTLLLVLSDAGLATQTRTNTHGHLAFLLWACF